jgi:metal-sulfur cluster biosynthetic enzyme
MGIDTSALGFVWKKEEGVLERIEPQGPGAKPTAATCERAPSAIREDAIAALQTVHDPEIPLNIWDLGLIYELVTEPAGFIDVKMTLTSPMCPAVGTLPPTIKHKLECVPGVSRVALELVFEPPGDKSRMTDAARLSLNI